MLKREEESLDLHIDIVYEFCYHALKQLNVVQDGTPSSCPISVSIVGGRLGHGLVFLVSILPRRCWDHLLIILIAKVEVNSMIHVVICCGGPALHQKKGANQRQYNSLDHLSD